MKADEIKQARSAGKFLGRKEYAGSHGTLEAVLMEIAIQLAELNEKLAAGSITCKMSNPEATAGEDGKR